MRQVCGSLAEAHRYGLVHRDLKPANILVAILGGKCDVAKVLDFGLVKLTATPDAPQLTADYTVSGTPQYMSPEQATATTDIDGRADIYSLGAILYFMLTGRPPFEGTNPTELMIAHARDPVVPPSHLRPEIPADLEAVVHALPRQEGRRPLSRRAIARRGPGEPAAVRTTGTTRRPKSGGSIRRRSRSRKLPPGRKPPLRLDRLQRLRLPGPVAGRPRRALTRLADHSSHPGKSVE